jgi:predicted deacetylase
MLESVGAPPVTLLVVPDYHRRGLIERDAGFLRTMDARLGRGDELALHGWRHIDEAPPPRWGRDWLRRRILTAGEGELAALGYEDAFDRIAQGVALWNRRCWPLHGFVPPGWLVSDAARRAVAAFSFTYTTTRTRIERADGSAALASITLCYSARSPLRRGLSRMAIDLQRVTSGRDLLRVALHPVDADHPAVLAHWRRVIARALAGREPMTKARWVRDVMEPSLAHGLRASVTPA